MEHDDNVGSMSQDCVGNNQSVTSTATAVDDPKRLQTPSTIQPTTSIKVIDDNNRYQNTASEDDDDDDDDEEESSSYQRELIQQKMNSLFQTLEPFIEKLDQHVIAVRSSQEMLNQELNLLLRILHQIRSQESPTNTIVSGSTVNVTVTGTPTTIATPLTTTPPTPMYKGRISNDISVDLEDKSRRLLGLKRRLTLVHSILSTVNSRVKKLLLAHNSRISIHN